MTLGILALIITASTVFAELKDSLDYIWRVNNPNGNGLRNFFQTRLRAIMISQEGFAEDDLKTLEKEVKDIVTEAATFSQESPEPHPDELWTDVLIPVEEKV